MTDGPFGSSGSDSPGDTGDDAFRVSVSLDQEPGGVALLEWAGAVDQETLDKAISLAADDVLLGHQARRVEVAVPVFDTMAVRSLHRAGFRREGRRREALRSDDGRLHDVLLYARLATDTVYGPEGFSAVMDSVLPMKRVIGHVVFTNEAGQVLLLQTTYKADWELPGGIIEPLEPPRLGAERECQEELGIGVELGNPVLIDWMPPSLGWTDALEYLWHASLPAATEFVQPEIEVASYNWVRPEQVHLHTSPLAARRIALVLDSVARGDEGVLITEDGRLLA